MTRKKPDVSKGEYGIRSAAQIPGNVEAEDFPNNDGVFADLKEIVNLGADGYACGARLVIKYSDGCTITWDYNAEK